MRITWVIGRTEAALLGDIGDIEFIIFDKNKGRGAYADVRAAVAGRHFDVVLCMHASLRANRLYRLLPSGLRLGFDFRRARDFQWLYTNRRIPAGRQEHALDAMMGFARVIGAAPTPLRWDIPLGGDDQAFAARTATGPTLVVSPLSSQRQRNFRNWPADRYAAVARHARDRHGCRILLTGGGTALEKDYGDVIVAQGGPGIVNLIGQTTLKQSLALFAAATAVLCPDSGPAHMATAVRTPVIGLYATSNPDRTGPYLSREYTVNRYPEAVQRYLGKTVAQVRWGRRVRHPDAMGLIGVDDVTAVIDRLFAERRSPGKP